MGSSRGTSSGSTLTQNSASEEGLKAVMDQRKRKRMISNRESARRSRMRKQKRMNDLTDQITRLKNENHHIMTSVSVTLQRYRRIVEENSVLRAQAAELSQRLESLDEITSFLKENSSCKSSNPPYEPDDDGFMAPAVATCYLNQPVIASADMLYYRTLY